MTDDEQIALISEVIIDTLEERQVPRAISAISLISALAKFGVGHNISLSQIIQVLGNEWEEVRKSCD